MILKRIRRIAAALLAVLGLTLSACGTGENVDSTPSAGTPPEQQTETNPAGEDPSPSQSEDLSPSQSGDPSPSQSEDPSPSQSGDPSPSQSGDPASSKEGDQTQSQSPSQGGTSSSGTYTGVLPESADVGNDWFADAVFVGDSRTDGLRLYSGIKGTNFICHTGLSVFTVGTNACIRSGDQKITAMDALGKQQYAKVYLMLGVNELGYSGDAFQSAYTKVVEQIKTLQPYATVYLQTLIPINEPIAYKNGTSRSINNEKLKQFNEIIAAVAQEQNVCLVDVAAPFWSADGCLAAENTSDGVHLSRAGYEAWFTYLRTHTSGGAAVYAPGGQDMVYPSSGLEDSGQPDTTPPGGYQVTDPPLDTTQPDAAQTDSAQADA